MMGSPTYTRSGRTDTTRRLTNRRGWERKWRRRNRTYWRDGGAYTYFYRTLIPCLTNKRPSKPHRSSLPLLSCRCEMVASAWTGLEGVRGQEFQSYRLQNQKQMLRARKRKQSFPTVLRRRVSACMGNAHERFQDQFTIDRLYVEFTNHQCNLWGFHD